MRIAAWLTSLVVVPAVGTMVIGGLVVAGTTPTTTAASCVVSGTAPNLTAEQQANAKAIAGVALNLGLGPRGVEIGIVAAITESTLQSLNYGDRNSNGTMTTSRGMFQMMDGWGTLADRLDPVKAATIFYTIDKGPGVRGLMHIPGWQQMTTTQAAQAVEGSQFSDGSNYQSNLAQAQTITAALTGAAPSCTPGTTTGSVTNVAGFTDSQDPTTFGWVHGGPLEPLVFQGHQFGQVAKGTATRWTAMLTELVPQIPGGLTSDIGCFDDRANVNNPSVLSFHAYGLACDLNTAQNPNGADPATLAGQYVIPPGPARTLAAKYGMIWGGDFHGTPDAMHFEIHVPPGGIVA